LSHLHSHHKAQISGGGLRFMIQSAFWFAVMALLVKLSGQRGLPTMQIVFARAVVTLLLSSLGLMRAGIRPFGSNTRLLVLRGLFGSGGLMCFYAAVNNLPLAEATVIHQISPVLTAVVAAIWIGEKLQARVMLGMALAFSGVLMIARPASLFAAGGDPDISWPFVIIGVCGAIFASLAYVAVRRLGKTEPAILVVFYFPIVTAPLSLPFAINSWVWPDSIGWVYLLGVGVVTQIAQIALTKGLAREPAGRAISVGYLQVAFATLFGAILFDALPGPWSWAGMIMIVGSVFVARSR
jgi:drug/metabolite transporter (DMT)-like permease